MGGCKNQFVVSENLCLTAWYLFIIVRLDSNPITLILPKLFDFVLILLPLQINMRPSCKSCDTVCKKCTFLKACEKGDVERVRACLFLYPDLDVNCSTKAEHFGLYYAAKYGYSELCDFLLAHPQIDINKKGGSNKSSALIKSFFEDNDDITRKLLEAGADPNSQDDDGNTLAGF